MGGQLFFKQNRREKTFERVIKEGEPEKLRVIEAPVFHERRNGD